MENWEQETGPNENAITVEAFDQLIDDIAKQRDVCDLKKLDYSRENEKLDDLERRALQALKDLGRKNFQGKAGTISIVERTSVKVPKDPEAKKAFLKYLQEKGVYDEMVTINSNTLSAFYKAEFEVAKQEGRGLEFQIPGLAEPTIDEITRFLRKK